MNKILYGLLIFCNILIMILVLPNTLLYITYSKSPDIIGYSQYMYCTYEPNYYIATYFYNANITKWCI